MNPRLTTALPLLAAIGSGALVAVQQRYNGDLGRALHDPLLSALISFGSGLVIMVVLMARRAPRLALRGLRDVVWWQRLGGLGGATIVLVGAHAAPKIGVALLTVGFVSGSTVAALVVDRAGFGPGGHRPLTPPRLVGAALCLATIALSAAEGLKATSPLLLTAVVLAGGLISLQQAFNGQVRTATSPTVATFWNFTVGTSALLVAFGVEAVVTGARADHWPTDWWVYSGGAVGTVFIAVAAAVVGRLGVLRLGLAVTSGQLIGGVLLDLGRGVSTTTLVASSLTLLAVLVSGRGAR